MIFSFHRARDKNNKQQINFMSLFVVSYANNKNSLSDNLEASLRKYGYRYRIIGEGDKWVNFMTKIRGCYSYLKKTEEISGDDIVVICDAYDVLACDYPEILIKKFKRFQRKGRKILVGSENKCGTNCIPLDKYYEYHNEPRGRYQYANGGFYMGEKNELIKMFRYILSQGIGDDQISLCNYINQYPEKVQIDSKGSVVSNIQIYSYGDTIWKNNKPYNKYTDESPCFIHTPAISFDLCFRLDYFGDRILGDEYSTLPIREKVSMVWTKTKKRWYWIVLVLLALIILFSLYKLAYR